MELIRRRLGWPLTMAGVPTVSVTRVLAAPPEQVWAALTEPEALAAWFWPASLAAKVSADPRPEGDYRIEAASMAVGGAYREVTPPRRLVFSWRWDGEGDESLVTIDLAPRGDETELVLRHDGLRDTEVRDLHVRGWNDCLDRLPGWLKGQPAAR